MTMLFSIWIDYFVSLLKVRDKENRKHLIQFPAEYNVSRGILRKSITFRNIYQEISLLYRAFRRFRILETCVDCDESRKWPAGSRYLDREYSETEKQPREEEGEIDLILLASSCRLSQTPSETATPRACIRRAVG